ncbi:MAG: acyltransferase [Pseudomonadota bacterium]
MRPGFSLWLDVLRVAAAFVVLLGHFAHTRFTRGDYAILREINIASDAVIVFFVLSGVVIAYAGERDGTLSRFAFNRLTRLFTVLVPALILTWVFDGIGTRIDPSAYQYPFYQSHDATSFFLRGLTFSNEWSGYLDRVRLGSNGPLWSLSYEAGFYAMFAAGVFLRGALRVVMILLLALILGAPVLALLPCWLAGVWLWHHLTGRGSDMSRALAWGLAVVPVFGLIFARMAGLPEFLTLLTDLAAYPATAKSTLHFSDEILWNSLIALAVSAHLMGVYGLAKTRRFAVDTSFARVTRWLAGGSFSLYVVHYPVLHLLDASLPESLPGYDLALLGGTLMVCYGFAGVFERPLKAYRTWILRLRPVRRVEA